MKLTFLGANHEVTGSCTLLQACGKNILVDCGMEQGIDIYENQPLPIVPGEVDAILLTHAHMDHAGRIPLMYKQGFRGPIYCTTASIQLCMVMLEDSAHIQEMEAEWKNRKAQRAGAPMVEPMYTIEDAQKVMAQFEDCKYGKLKEIAPDIQVRFIDAGHLLGSASIEVFVTENGKTEKIVFSGDIGNVEQPLIKNPEYIDSADYVVMESTYGDRFHGEKPNYVKELAEIVQETLDRGGNVVIPSFAVGRTQEMLYFLRQIKEEKLVKGHEGFPVYVDSPLANEATTIFRKSFIECYDEEALELVNAGVNPIGFKDLRISLTSDDSRAINADDTPKVIISASGMCDAGRIRHHLKHNLWRKECTILFVGYQAGATLGRALVEGAKEVRLFGEHIEVQAQIRQLTGMSGHADRNGLDKWITSFTRQKPGYVFVNHGEDTVTDVYAAHLRELGFEAGAPYNGAVCELADGKVTWLAEGNRVRLEHKKQTQGGRAASVFYQQLVMVQEKLERVVKNSNGLPNKDLKKFAAQLEALCEQWTR